MLTTLLFALQANQPPFPPSISEPPVIGPLVNPGDVHMGCAFSDPDPGDVHTATDWEIWTVAPSERVWTHLGATGHGLTHALFGEGDFEGSHAGLWSLFENTSYLLRVRHRDDSGDPATEWGTFGLRAFNTGSAQGWFALELDDVLDAPAPRWTEADGGAPVDLLGGPVPAQLVVETGVGTALVTVSGAGGSDTVTNAAPLAGPEAVRVRLWGGGAGLTLPATDLELHATGCAVHTLLLPAVSLGPFQTRLLWVSDDGVTFDATPGQSAPDFSSPARLPDPPWLPEQPGYVIESFATGFALPVDVAFVPDPGPAPDDVLMYVSELYGAIRAVRRDGSVGTYAADLLNYDPPLIFPGSGEQGLTGLAVDPLSGDVFASMLYDTGTGTPWNPVAYPRVVRFSSLDGGRTASSQVTVLDFVGEVQGQSHQISNLHVTADGKLLVHMGDGFDSTTAKDLGSFRGKVLRCELDGSAPADNPLYDPADGIDARDFVWASGLRNPFGGDVRAADGLPYVVENGPWQDRFARLAPGVDLGWNGSGSSMSIGAAYNWYPARAPVDLAFAQTTSFGGGGFPAVKLDHAFVSLSGPTYVGGPQEGAKRIEEFVLEADGSVVGEPVPLVSYVGDGQGSISGLAFGPDGLYFATLYPEEFSAGPDGAGASILRVRYAGLVDCNGNGLSDACDIAAGTSADCNGDGIPDECQLAATAVRPGDPPNPAVLNDGGGPVLGGTWQPRVDHSTFEPGAVFDVLVVTTLPANAPTPLGTLLCDLASGALWFQAAAGVTFQLPIPADCGLIGAAVHAQATSVGPFGELALTNALDLVLGL